MAYIKESTAIMLSQFVAKKPKETSGQRSANRFDYQLSWAFCLLLDLEKSSTDYLVVLDHHDDIVVFDSEVSPTFADFYQVKTDSRNRWTLDRLLERATETSLSIIGKLYGHRLDFENGARTLSFVSNQCYSLQLKSSPKGRKNVDNCFITDLCDEAFKKVTEQIQQEHALPDLPTVGVDIVLKRDEMITAGHKSYAEGRLSRFLAEQYGDKPYRVSHAFTALIDVLRRRNNCEDELFDVSDLKHKKSMGHTEFSSLISRIARSTDDTQWRTIEQLLIQEGTKLLELKKYKAAWNAREIALLDPSNVVVQQSQIIIDQVVKSTITRMPTASISDLLSTCLLDANVKLGPLGIPFGEDHVIGAILSSITTHFT